MKKKVKSLFSLMTFFKIKRILLLIQSCNIIENEVSKCVENKEHSLVNEDTLTRLRGFLKSILSIYNIR
jgi:hypothetical protein